MLHKGHTVFLLFISVFLYGNTPYIEQIKIVDQCTYLTEPLSVPALGIKGAEFQNIEAVKAVRACQESHSSHPDDHHIEFLLARAFFRGGQYHEGIDLLRSSCEHGDIGGCTLLGSQYHRGLYNGQYDQKKAVLLWQWSCSLGDPLACHNLAMLSDQKSDYVSKEADIKQAYLLGSCLSDLFPPACAAYANHIYFKTIPYDRDLYEYTSYIACFSGDQNSCYFLKKVLEESNDTMQQKKLYFSMQASCKNGNANACESVGSQYNSGGDSKLNHLLAYTQYEEGCNNGAECFACWYAGRYKIIGAEGVAQDIPRGINYLEKSCYIGMNTFACYDLALFYLFTSETKYRDRQKAVKPLERACKIGNVRSLFLGCDQGIAICCTEKKRYEEIQSKNK